MPEDSLPYARSSCCGPCHHSFSLSPSSRPLPYPRKMHRSCTSLMPSLLMSDIHTCLYFFSLTLMLFHQLPSHFFFFFLPDYLRHLEIHLLQILPEISDASGQLGILLLYSYTWASFPPPCHIPHCCPCCLLL